MSLGLTMLCALLLTGLKRLAKDSDLLTAAVSSVEQLLQVDQQNSHRATMLVKLDMKELSQRFAAVYEPGKCLSKSNTWRLVCSVSTRLAEMLDGYSLTHNICYHRNVVLYKSTLSPTCSQGLIQRLALGQNVMPEKVYWT